MTLSLQIQKFEPTLGLYFLSNQALSPVSSILLLPILSIPATPYSLPVSWFSLTPSASPLSLWLPLAVLFYLRACLVNFLLEPSNDFLLQRINVCSKNESLFLKTAVVIVYCIGLKALFSLSYLIFICGRHFYPHFIDGNGDLKRWIHLLEEPFWQVVGLVVKSRWSQTLKVCLSSLFCSCRVSTVVSA